MELRNSIARRFDLDLPATLMFDQPSLAALAAYLAGQLAPAASMQLMPVAASAAQVAQAAETAVTAVVGVSARFPGGISGKPSCIPPLVCSLAGATAAACPPVSHRDLPPAYSPHCPFPSTCPFPPSFVTAGLPSFWEAANGGADLQREVPLERWDVEAGYHPSLAPQGMTIYVRFGAFCSGKHRAEGGGG